MPSQLLEHKNIATVWSLSLGANTNLLCLATKGVRKGHFTLTCFNLVKRHKKFYDQFCRSFNSPTKMSTMLEMDIDIQGLQQAV